MKNPNIVFIGLDTHKESTHVAYVHDGFNTKPEYFGKVASQKRSMAKLVRQLQSKYPNATLHFVYEAGPCGYYLYRLLTQLSQPCYIVAPSLIPKKPGDRVKTDKRDSMMLAQLLKNGDVSAIYVPAAQDEAMRDLSRGEGYSSHARGGSNSTRRVG